MLHNYKSDSSNIFFIQWRFLQIRGGEKVVLEIGNQNFKEHRKKNIRMPSRLKFIWGRFKMFALEFLTFQLKFILQRGHPDNTSPKREVLGRTSRRISGWTSRDENFLTIAWTAGKEALHFCTDVHDPKARVSMTRGVLRKNLASKLRADSSFTARFELSKAVQNLTLKVSCHSEFVIFSRSWTEREQQECEA